VSESGKTSQLKQSIGLSDDEDAPCGGDSERKRSGEERSERERKRCSRKKGCILISPKEGRRLS